MNSLMSLSEFSTFPTLFKELEAMGEAKRRKQLDPNFGKVTGDLIEGLKADWATVGSCLPNGDFNMIGLLTDISGELTASNQIGYVCEGNRVLTATWHRENLDSLGIHTRSVTNPQSISAASISKLKASSSIAAGAAEVIVVTADKSNPVEVWNFDRSSLKSSAIYPILWAVHRSETSAMLVAFHVPGLDASALQGLKGQQQKTFIKSVSLFLPQALPADFDETKPQRLEAKHTAPLALNYATLNGQSLSTLPANL